MLKKKNLKKPPTRTINETGKGSITQALGKKQIYANLAP